MKKSLMCFVLFLSCLFTNYSFAEHMRTFSLKRVLHSVNKDITQGKIYIQAEDVIISNEGVFLNVGGQLLEVRGIGHDANGIYATWWNGDDEDDELWECQKCMTLNKMTRYRCRSCGWDRRN